MLVLKRLGGGSRRWATVFLATIATIGLTELAASGRDQLIVHEWGTFTSVQSGDGMLLRWSPLESSQLPSFVYDWKHPGAGRIFSGGYMWGKGEITGLQRMETPVIYFYSQKEREVSASVSFPHGIITEWFPQATQIGPSTKMVPGAVAKADEVLHKAGVKPNVTVEALFDQSATQQSSARWARFHVMPAQNNRPLLASLPRDKSGSHYFSARETDAAFVQMDSLISTNPAPEVEKFIFYRGVGNFSTPLHVAVGSGESVTITNMADNKLEAVFLLRVEHRTGKFSSATKLNGHEQLSVPFDRSAMQPIKEVSQNLAEAVKQSLISAGLYPREAAAMVSTWKDSWFEEEGLRVLYVLPRAWTDKTLPLKIDPTPDTVTRVMVGRAEVLTPALQKQLIVTLLEAGKGDAAKTGPAAAELKKLGRFAEPALQLASQTAPDAVATGWKLLQAARAEKLQTSNTRLQ